MWYRGCNIIFIFIWSAHCKSATAKVICDYDYKGYTFNQTEVGDPPANIREIWLHTPSPTDPPELRVRLADRTDDFNFTVFFIPFLNNLDDCPSSLNETQNLRQYKRTCPVYKDDDKNMPLIFGQISTGCYYCIMTTAEGNNWEWGPIHKNTSYQYYDTKMELKKTNIQNVDTNSRKLSAELIIPLSCIEVYVKLYQIDNNVNAMDDIKEHKILRSHRCWISMNDSNVLFNCEVSKLVTKLDLDVHLVKVNGEKWTIVTTWTQLQAAGGTYYLQFVAYTSICETYYGYDAMNTWRTIERNNLLRLDYYDPIPTPSPPQPDSVYHILTIVLLVCVLLGVTVVALLVYRRKQDLKLDLNQPCSKESISDGQTSILLPDEQKSDHILLIYARDCPEFMKLMDQFRDNLAEACGCHVVDLYTPKDWKLIGNYGASQWIAKQLEDGCRIVWVDTPRFRSRLNDEQDGYNIGDFRDLAVPYAVRLATGIYLDAMTQYTRHFVVRMEGYEVKDRHDDPLRAVASYTRFYIPRHTSHLHKEMRESMCFEAAATKQELEEEESRDP